MPSLTLAKRAPSHTARCVAIAQGGQCDGLYLWVDADGVSRGPHDQKIQLPCGSFFTYEPPHDPKARFMLFLGAASGGGKSTQMRLIAERYHKLFPHRQQVLISKLDEDETLDSAPWIKRINVQTLVDHPFELAEARDSLVIVDDVEGLPLDQAVAVQKAVEIIATQGRHNNASLLYASHNLTNYKQTRLLHQEVGGHVVFPLSSSYHQLRYLLEKYDGLDPHEIKAIRRLPSRWVIVLRQYPAIVIWESGAMLPHSMDA